MWRSDRTGRHRLPSAGSIMRHWRASADWLARHWRRARQLGRSVIGIPDYDTYLRHCREHHPERAPMDYRQFFDERQAARYRGTGGRCC